MCASYKILRIPMICLKMSQRYHETYKNIRTFNKKIKKRNGRVENRTLDLLLARQALYQLSYTPFLLKTISTGELHTIGIFINCELQSKLGLNIHIMSIYIYIYLTSKLTLPINRLNQNKENKKKKNTLYVRFIGCLDRFLVQ